MENIKREIKFRVWIRIGYEFQEEKRPYKMIYPHKEKDIWYVLDLKTQTLMEGDGGEISHFPQYIMQFTGLKDKKGKEIYEGDICKNNKGEISTVYWVDYIDTDRYWELGSGFLICFDEDFAEDCIVIGNIYETPELA